MVLIFHVLQSITEVNILDIFPFSKPSVDTIDQWWFKADTEGLETVCQKIMGDHALKEQVSGGFSL
jgi:hypothetical protein